MLATKPRTAAGGGGRPPGRGEDAGATVSGLRAVARLSTSCWALICWLILMTVLAAGPLHGFDRALSQRWSEWIFPEWGPIVAKVINPIASQAMAVPILGIVAVLLAWRRRSWLPILAGAMAEFGAAGIGVIMKLSLARPAPVGKDPAFFHGGILSDGWHGISYPSGHALEAVALYGAAVFLIARYSSVSKNMVVLLSGGVVVITVVTVLQSLYMRWHWATDLAGGILAGALVLRTVIDLDRTVLGKPRLRPPYAMKLSVPESATGAHR